MFKYKWKKISSVTAVRVFLIGLLSFILFNCQQDRDKYEIRHAMTNLPVSLTPSIDKNIDAIQIYSQLYETLISLDHDFKTLKPNLCKSWEIDSGNKSFTFHLRDDVWFHDDSKLDASSVKYSIDWLKNQNKCSLILNSIKKITVKDDTTFTIILNEPRPTFIYALASPSEISIISESALRKYGDKISNNPIGTGPFKLKEWRNNHKIVLTRNDSYWKSKVKIENIIFLGFNKYSQIEKNLKENKVDIAYAIQGYSLDRLKWLGKIDYVVNEPINTIFIGFNIKNPILANKNIRKALSMSVNTNKIVTLINRGNAEIANNPLPKTFLHFNRNPLEYNPVEAKKILTGEGYKNDLQLNFYYPKNFFSRQTFIESIKTAYKKVDISLHIRSFNSWKDHEKAMESDSSQIFIYGWGAEILGDAGNFLRTLFYSSSKTNFFHYKNKQVDNILDKALIEKNKTIRENYYHEAVDLILNDIPAVFLMHVKEFYAYNKDKIKSVKISPYGIICYDKITLK